MANDYQTYGERRMIDGDAHYSQGYRSDGMTYGYVYWNERVFMEQPDEVCYIPEHAFDDATAVTVDGEDYYPADEVGGYTRRDLERMLEGETDEDGDAITVEDFFHSLFWCYPETRLMELTY